MSGSLPDPSTSAASMTNGLMFCRPAWKITTLSPSAAQIVMRQTASSASRGSSSHCGGDTRNTFEMTVDSQPSPRSSCCQISATATEDVTTGAKNMTMMTARRLTRLRKTAMTIARKSPIGTVTAAMMSVLRTERMKSGSCTWSTKFSSPTNFIGLRPFHSKNAR